MNQALQLYELSVMEDHHQESNVMLERHPHRESLSTIDDLCYNMLSKSFESDDLALTARGENDKDSVGSASTRDDPLIGITICIPKDFDLDFAPLRKQNPIFPAAKRTMSKDMPISMSASGRNVSMRRHSMDIVAYVPISRDRSDDDEVDDARIHSRARRESQLSLPAKACSYEDRFAGSSVSMNGKVDKLLPTPVKRRRDVVSHKIASSVPTLSPMLF